MDATCSGVRERNRILEGGRCLRQAAASAEDCTISQSTVYGNTRCPPFYLSYGRAGDAESVGKQALAVRQKLGNLSDIAVSQV